MKYYLILLYATKFEGRVQTTCLGNLLLELGRRQCNHLRYVFYFDNELIGRHLFIRYICVHSSSKDAQQVMFTNIETTAVHWKGKHLMNLHVSLLDGQLVG